MRPQHRRQPSTVLTSTLPRSRMRRRRGRPGHRSGYVQRAGFTNGASPRISRSAERGRTAMTSRRNPRGESANVLSCAIARPSVSPMTTMVGRDQELAAVVGSLTAPEVALTLVMGEAGIGKSRLVAEAVEATPERLTLTGGCLPMRHALPLLPVVDALDSRDPTARRALTRAARSLPGPLRPHIAGVMPRTLPDEIRPAEEVRQDQLFVATEALLSRIGEERPVTL